jgi:16S rRNA (guanine966-N2)-methyltransferase
LAWLGWADMSRIIGGSGKGRRLKSPRGNATRPTASRVRQALFDILASEVPGCRFLDLFAGGGGVGLEACSRGAAGALLVEADGAAARAIRANVAALGLEAVARVARADVRAELPRIAASGQRFGIVFLDPPYGSPLYEPVLSAVAAGSILAQGGVVVAEHFHKRALPETIGRLSRTRVLRVGEQCLSFYRPTTADGE